MIRGYAPHSLNNRRYIDPIVFEEKRHIIILDFSECGEALRENLDLIWNSAKLLRHHGHSDWCEHVRRFYVVDAPSRRDIGTLPIQNIA